MLGKQARKRTANILDKNREKIVAGIQSKDTSTQVRFLTDALNEGQLPVRTLRRNVEKNARKEMKKGYNKIIGSGEIPTVDLLLMEYQAETEFKNLAERVGLDESWFIALAEEEIARRTG